jgi:hypothetical protein
MSDTMKTAIKFLAVLFAVFCFVFACEVTQQDRKPLTSADEMFNLRDTLPAGGVMPQALKVVPGISWIEIISDSLGNEYLRLLSQNPITGVEGWTTENTILDWLIGILPDSLSLSGYTDTLTITAIGDSISIQGSNSVQVPFRLYGVDTLSDIYTKTFPSGSRIINRANGAQYLVQADSVSGYTTDSVAVIPTGGSYAVLQPQQGQYDVTWFGAVGDGVTNNDLQKIVDYTNGRSKIQMPSGLFAFSEGIIVGDLGISLHGVGMNDDDIDQTRLLYTGTGDAISFSGLTTGVSKVVFSNFALIGSDSAGHAINMNLSGQGLSLNGSMKNVYIKSFDKIGSAGIIMEQAYSFHIEDCRFIGCYDGIVAGNETVNVSIDNTWINNSVRYGIHSTYGGNVSINKCIIDFNGSPTSSQRGIYVESGDIHIEKVLFEGNYQHVEIASAAEATIQNCKFNSSTINGTFADGARVRLFGNILPSNSSITAGLGTEWYGDIEGTHSIPSITGDNPVGFATVTYLDGSAGSFTLAGYSANGVPDGEFTLIFLDDSVTISHNASGQVIRLKDGLPFKGYTGDRISFRKQMNESGTVTIIETGRVRTADNSYQARSSDYVVQKGDHEITFSNIGATDTVEFTLPAITSFTEKPKYTFVRWANQVVRITPDAFRGIRGASGNGSSVFLNDQGTTITLQLDSLRWDIVASNGLYSYQSPGSNNAGGNFAGISFDRIRDSVGVSVTNYTADQLPIGDGDSKFTFTSNLVYNLSGSSAARRIDINNSTANRVLVGIGQPELGSNRPGLYGYKNSDNPTTIGAVSLVGVKHGGTYTTKTDLAVDTALLVSIIGYGWRNNSLRTAASITLEGGKSMGASTYSGVIGFNTATTSAFARRATIHRNGDFYLGDGLPTNDLASPSAKIYIRSNSTTGSEYAMLIENSAETDLFSIRNGGEVNVGNLTDIGNYILQITGDTYIDGSLTVTDSIILNGLSIISGTAAPDAGLGSQGSLYLRDDNDSTLYTKTGTGWVLLN